LDRKKKDLQERIKKELEERKQLWVTVSKEVGTATNTKDNRKKKDNKEVKWIILKEDRTNLVNVNNTFKGAKKLTDPKEVNTINKSWY